MDYFAAFVSRTLLGVGLASAIAGGGLMAVGAVVVLGRGVPVGAGEGLRA
ncbi:MAG: hypothetical protein LC793_12900 [Thermomicrobia bacterium]|nr:hypothetical protein [Thermomicrobia bacterium]MCA1723134.1 hypothetical protein [Thermomicrobia bacterium]